MKRSLLEKSMVSLPSIGPSLEGLPIPAMGEALLPKFKNRSMSHVKKVLLAATLLLIVSQLKAAIVYVDLTATGANDGTNWLNAYTDLCDALLKANGGDEIWVAQGVHKPTRNRLYALNAPAFRQKATFMLKSKVSVYGGFDGTETLRSQRDAINNVTTLSGDHTGNDNGSLLHTNSLLSDNSLTVVTAEDLVSGEEFDGFHIVNGASIQPSVVGATHEFQYGAGMYISQQADFSIIDCQFYDNTAYLDGGGIFIYPQGNGANTTVNLLNVEIRNNKTRILGSAIAVNTEPNTSANLTASHLTIANNQLCQSGSAMSLESEKGSSIKAELTNVIARENQSSGGTFYNKANNQGSVYLSLTNALIVQNTAAKVGSAFFNDGRSQGYCEIEVINSTIADNICSPSSTLCYSAAYNSGTCTTNMVNTIVDGNQPSNFGAFGGATYNMDYCLVDAATCPTGITCGANMFYNQSPGFTNQVGGDYSTSATSFGTDQGLNSAITGVTTDLIGNNRIENSVVDLGPYESAPCPSIIYVNAIAAGANDGSTWANAFLDLQDALALARSLGCVQEIWVAAGLYNPHPSDRTIYYDLVNDVDMYGGFPNTGNPTMTDRDASVHSTVLSGEINSLSTRTDNSYHVFRAHFFSNYTIFDGFDIESAYYKITSNPNSSPTSYGAARWRGPGRISNCTFTLNFSFYYAGALEATGVELEKCTFQNNEAPFYGGALVTRDNVIVKSCRFLANGSSVGGGLFIGGESEYYNCLFKSNFVRTHQYWNCITGNPFSDEFAQGGAVHHDPYVFSSSPSGPIKIVNSSFYGNYGVNAQGGTFSTEDAGPGNQLQFYNCIIRNSTVSGNQCEDPFGSGSFNAPCQGPIGTSGTPGGRVDFFDCNVQSTNSSQFYFFLNANFYGNTQTANPQFNNPGANDFRLQSSSPSINAGNSANVPVFITTDISGNVRIDGSSVDMGCYENFPGSQQRVAYVNPIATGANNGSSWTDAFNNLQDALDNSNVDGSQIEEIWLAEGTYYPTEDLDRTQSFEFRKGVKVFGGFKKKGNPNFADRDPERFRTTLSGDIGKKDNKDDDSYHLGTMVIEDEIMMMNGVTIEGGNADGSGKDGKGGGLLIISKNANVKLVDVNINGCYAQEAGAAICASGAHLSIENSTIENNHCGNLGAAIFNENGSIHSSGNVFVENTSLNGSIIYCTNTQLNQLNDRLTENTCASGVVVIVKNDNNDATHSISGSLFNQNECFDGSIIQVENQSNTQQEIVFVNTSFVANESYNSDGAILHYKGTASAPDHVGFRNCLFSQNLLEGFISDPENPNYKQRPSGLVSWSSHAKLSFFDCALPGEDVHMENPGIKVERQAYGNMLYLNDDPTNPEFVESYLKGHKNDQTSFLEDAGNKSHLNTAMQMDLLGNDRIMGSTVDIGTFELDGANALDELNSTGSSLAIQVYPNPASQQVKVQLSKNTRGTIQLFNMQGMLMYTTAINGVTAPIDVQDFPAGLYKVVVHNTGGTQITESLMIAK